MSEERLWIGGYGPRESAHGKGLSVFRDLVRSGTGGSVEVDVTWNIMDTGRSNTDLLDLVESAEMFLCYFSTSYLADRVPELNVIETPFLFEDLGEAHRALDGELGRRLKGAVRERTPMEALGFWDNGFRHLTNRHRPVRGPDDLSGMKVRIQPNAVHEALVRSWGAIPVPVDLRRGIELIRSLDVDAQENPLANTVAYGVHRVHGHVTMSAHLYGARGLFAHGETYRSLDPAMRAVVDEAVSAAVGAQREAARRIEEDLRSDLAREGVQFVDGIDVDRTAFIERSSPAMDLARSQIPPGMAELVAR